MLFWDEFDRPIVIFRSVYADCFSDLQWIYDYLMVLLEPVTETIVFSPLQILIFRTYYNSADGLIWSVGCL